MLWVAGPVRGARKGGWPLQHINRYTLAQVHPGEGWENARIGPGHSQLASGHSCASKGSLAVACCLALLMSAPAVELLPFGVVVIRNCVTEPQQRALLAYLLASAPIAAKTAELERPETRYSQLCMWNWPSRYGAMAGDAAVEAAPEEALARAREAVAIYRASLPPTAEVR